MKEYCRSSSQSVMSVYSTAGEGVAEVPDMTSNGEGESYRKSLQMTTSVIPMGSVLQKTIPSA